MERISDLEKQYALEALSNQFSTSKNSIFISRLEKKFAQLFNTKYAISFVNGTATLHTAIVALGIKPGDEVIVPPLTMSSTALSVLENNSIPVFADVDLKTFTLDPASVEKCITSKTKAIMAVSLYGISPDYDALLAICKKHNLYLIEDNAECFLGKYKGKYVGEFGDFSSFSFQASKHLTAGEGGMLITNDEEFANNARRFSSLGYGSVSASKGKISKDDIQDPQFDRHVALGFNYRMSEISAAVCLAQVERANELVQCRIQAAKLFDEAVLGSGILERQAEPDGYLNSYWAYSMVLKTENPKEDWYKFRKIFQKNGGDSYYAAWKLSYNEPYFQKEVQNIPGVWQKYNQNLCPNAEYLQLRMIQLKTNYWDIEEAKAQAKILKDSIAEYKADLGMAS
jgi:perosamine synthetase